MHIHRRRGAIFASRPKKLPIGRAGRPVFTSREKSEGPGRSRLVHTTCTKVISLFFISFLLVASPSVDGVFLSNNRAPRSGKGEEHHTRGRHLSHLLFLIRLVNFHKPYHLGRSGVSGHEGSSLRNHCAKATAVVMVMEQRRMDTCWFFLLFPHPWDSACRTTMSRICLVVVLNSLCTSLVGLFSCSSAACGGKRPGRH